ncbi:hypothetical protein AAFP30_04400 [Gordonia sp. CPCC 205515]|uniref:hypothetical protein n=1 Tax=Gordonia sp. CPCC 205515 TaxID=3140791 RepID=UPI003AF34FB5
MRAKLAGVVAVSDVIFRRIRLRDIAVGHSAHVASRGYVPAAPFRSPGATLDTTACFLTDDELITLDTTEPNYHRMTLSTAELLGDPTTVAAQSYSLYTSKHGVLADPTSGMPVPLGTQQRILSWLGDRVTDEVLQGPAAEVCARLSETTVAARIFAAMHRNGLVVDARMSELAQPAVAGR